MLDIFLEIDMDNVTIHSSQLDLDSRHVSVAS